MIETRVLDSNASREIILQLKFNRNDVCIRPHELIEDVRSSLAQKIAVLLFEKIEPKILSILEESNE